MKLSFTLTLTTLLFVLLSLSQAVSARGQPDQDNIPTVKRGTLDTPPLVARAAPGINVGPSSLDLRRSLRKRSTHHEKHVTGSSKKHKAVKHKSTHSGSLPNSSPHLANLTSDGGNGGTGICTFNTFETQQSVACQWSKSLSNLNPHSYSSGSPVFAAAVSDMSRAVWTSAPCNAPPPDAKWCNGHGGAVSNAPEDVMAPSCPGEFPENGGPCGSCYHIVCIGSQDGETSGSCNPKGIIVRVIDACPSAAAGNYCKTTKYGGSVVDGACASSTNQFDIAHQAQSALSTFQGNLKISFSKVTCPAGV